jgi:lambda family phage portal protein
MFSEHPGNSYLGLSLDRSSKAIPASEIAHVYPKHRTQVRGVPWGSAVMSTLFDLGTYENAEIIRKKLEACMVGVILGGDDQDFALGAALNPDQQRSFGVKDSDGVVVEKFEPGLFVHAEGGKDVKFNQPAATGSYEGYKKATLHTIAAGFHIPYMLLSHDLSGANYASSKMGFGPFIRMIETVQWLFVIPMLLQPMWEWFCEAAFLAGLIPSTDIPVRWMTPRMYSADPEKDARATVLEVRNGLKPLSAAIGERGYDADEVLDEYQQTNKKLDDRKLIFDSDPRKQSANGQKQALDDGGGSTPPE